MPYSKIHTYAFHNKLEELKKEIKDIDVNVINPFSWTALHIASWIGNYDIVEYLLEQSDIVCEIKDNRGRTPLDIAISNGHSKIVYLLLSRST